MLMKTMLIKTLIYVFISLGAGWYCLENYGSDALDCFILGYGIMWFAMTDLTETWRDKND